jgi:hypothetical protein
MNMTHDVTGPAFPAGGGADTGRSPGGPRITVPRGSLAAAVAYASRALPRYAPLPVLDGMRAQVAGGRLILAAFCYDKAIRATVDGDAAVPGAVLADGRQLVAAVKALPAGKTARVTVEADDAALTLTCGSARAAVPLVAHPENYPAMPELPPAVGTVDGGAFARSRSPQPTTTGWPPTNCPGCPPSPVPHRARSQCRPRTWPGSRPDAGTR